ncbi:MAG: methylisocitrate lyase [Rhodospirillaceae bacterium]|jgi:methylisocitrate lyase|nr:methylisocitrate lyase [Rhodospirillaceae bacterium]MDP6644330.1 methylisocitrate lyase [Rhodospirillales bacterium]|tara:strand:- start:232 stop:1125 length:894 start_codon:yes stop_codon:yes gene_type:complete
MLFAEKTPAEKRQGLRDALASGRLLRFPGAHAPIVGRIAEETGFDGVYISGAALSADLALPDIGLTTLAEVAGRGRQIAGATDLPSIIDADTGFGESMNAARTVREMEDAGLSGCHIEDQVLPKRCGHLDNKTLIETVAMARKIRAAADAKRDSNFLIMARTDANAVEGLDATIQRAKAYVDAGAEALFPEALTDKKQYETFRAAFDVPLLANMTEFGKTPLLTTRELEDLGFNIVIYPVTSLRLAMKAIEDGFAEIMKEGTQAGIVERMQTRKRLYEVLRYEDYNSFDQDIFNFKL